MDAETMVEKLEAVARGCDGMSGDAGRAETLRAIAAALRAQAKAEPVAWLTDAGNLHRDKRVAFAFGAQSVTPLYTAPPPDHAEALAEAITRLSDALDAMGDDDPDFAGKWAFVQEAQEEANNRLTRYKERTNV